MALFWGRSHHHCHRHSSHPIDFVNGTNDTSTEKFQKRKMRAHRTCSRLALLVLLATYYDTTGGESARAGARTVALAAPSSFKLMESGGKKDKQPSVCGRPATIKLQQRKQPGGAFAPVDPRDRARRSAQWFKQHQPRYETRRSIDGNGAATVKLTGHPVITYHALLHMGSDQQDVWVVSHKLFS